MILKEQWGNGLWTPEDAEDLVHSLLSGCENKELRDCYLSEVLGRIIDRLATSDQDKLELTGIYGWEIAP